MKVIEVLERETKLSMNPNWQPGTQATVEELHDLLRENRYPALQKMSALLFKAELDEKEASKNELAQAVVAPTYTPEFKKKKKKGKNETKINK